MLEAAARRLSDVAFAVRSSAGAEDLAEASFAGQYETVLDVRGTEELSGAIRRVKESAGGARVEQYRAARTKTEEGQMAVLVQRMVPAEVAGVAFTANPVTGGRDEVVITAVRGHGERLVAGEAIGDQWQVKGGEARCLRLAEDALDASQAAAIAALARRVEDHMGGPQDIEWAIAAGQIYVLQARPMTALPAPLEWSPPGPGFWLRNFRLGEWLPEPVTPLFEEWLLKLLNMGFARGNEVDAGLGVGLRQAIVNGWYYSTPQPDVGLATALKALSTRPLTLVRLATSALKQSTDPDLAERRYFGRVVRRWREEALPRYRELVEDRSTGVESASVKELFGIIDEIGQAAGEQLWCLVIGGGSAWKIEVALARFYHRHLAGKVELDIKLLLVGLPDSAAGWGSHVVQSADWYRPTLGETDLPAPSEGTHTRHRRLEEQRQAAETACRKALAADPQRLGRFEVLLELAQHYARLREEQAYSMTLSWPLLRNCVLRLGGEAVERGALARPEDAFFLTRAELEAVVTGNAATDLSGRIQARRTDWERSRRLAAPLTLGTPPKLLARIMGSSLELLRSGSAAPEGSLRGEPASPGRASGVVRVVRGLEDFDRFRQGEVLVAQATAPAWTPLFALAAAVVTDGGTIAAHASLVAREYGIPAVVATGDATSRLIDGQHVTVDGSGGWVLARS